MKDASTGFTGSTAGQQFFDSQQDGPPLYDVVNLHGDAWAQVGTYSPDGGLRLSQKIVWPGGSLATPTCDEPGYELALYPDLVVCGPVLLLGEFKEFGVQANT